MIDIDAPRLPGLNVTVGSFLPRLRLPSLAGPLLAPVDMVEEGGLAVCVYNPAAVNPFPLPPRGVDLPARMAMLEERGVSLYVISGLDLTRLANWMTFIRIEIHGLSDADGEFARVAGIPIKRVDGRNFRTHAAFVLQEDRVLSILLETDPIHHFEQLLMALAIAADDEPGQYVMSDAPWYSKREECLTPQDE